MTSSAVGSHCHCAGCGSLFPKSWITNHTNGASKIGNICFCSQPCEEKWKLNVMLTDRERQDIKQSEVYD